MKNQTLTFLPYEPALKGLLRNCKTKEHPKLPLNCFFAHKEQLITYLRTSHLPDVPLALEAYVDSGATYSVFTAQVANRLGLAYRTGRRVYVQVGDGSFIPGRTQGRSLVLKLKLLN